MDSPAATFRVSVRTTDREELERAVAILSRLKPDEVHRYDGLVTGLADRDVLRELMAAGLIVDRSSDEAKAPAAPAAPAPEEPPVMAEIRRRAEAYTRSRAPRPGGGVFGMVEVAPPPQPPQVYDVRLLGPMRPEWGAFFNGNDIRITSYAPPFRYRMALTEGQAETVRAQAFVSAVEPYSLEETLSPELVRLLEEAEQSPSDQPIRFDLMVHAPEQAESIARMIQDSGQGVVESVSGRSIRFHAPVLSPLVSALAARTEVKWITPYQAPELFCDFGRALIGIAAVEQAPGGPWDGTGEVVGLLDSGADQAHPDLQGRIQSYQTVPGATPQDRAGHGTHVAGILCGTGAGSNGKVRGVAPGAELAVVGIVNPQNTPLLPADMGPLLDLAVRKGARIINLSLGLSQNRYDQYAESIDQFVFDNPGILVVAAAGNSGTAKQGYPDFNTLSTPASAKNLITVGACLSNRAGLTTTWSQYNAGSFAGAPVGPGLLTGPPIIPAALSSRGPTDYDSFKPDVVAPGTYILSAQASGGTLPSYAPVPPGTGPYIYLNGTSMAAPFVSGAAAVLRHYLRQEMKVSDPSAALLKALLCASATREPSVMSAAVEPRVGYPDFDQGLGLVSLDTILPHQDAQGLRLSFVDVANGSADALQSRVPPGAARRANRLYTVTVAAGGSPLRVVLVWTDAPGRYVQNTLQLDVRGPNVHLIGNHEHTYKQDPLFQSMGLPGVPFDRKNNVQVVNLTNAAAGEYTINVLADNTPDPNHFQGYALVVTGRLAGAVSEEAPAF